MPTIYWAPLRNDRTVPSLDDKEFRKMVEEAFGEMPIHLEEKHLPLLRQIRAFSKERHALTVLIQVIEDHRHITLGVAN
jgi:hypothetical protein